MENRIWIGSIVLDTPDLARMISFWQEAISYLPREAPEADGVVLKDPHGRGPNLSINRADEQPLDDHRMHLRLSSTDPKRLVDRLCRLGASVRPTDPNEPNVHRLATPDTIPFDVIGSSSSPGPNVTARIGSVVQQCARISETAAFWTEALHFRRGGTGVVDQVGLRDPGLREPKLVLVQADVPPGRDYRLHLDLYSSHLQDEVDRLLHLGAHLESAMTSGHDFATLLDPDGCPFDVIDKPGWRFGQRV